MALSRSPRFGLWRWSAGTDTFTRQQMEESHAAIETLGAIDVQGTMAARPAAGVRGRYYTVIDANNANDGITFRDTGSAWLSLGRRTFTVRVPHTFHLSGDVLVPSGDNFYVPPMFVAAPSGQTARIVAVRHRINSGTSATFDLRADGTTVAGYAGLIATPTPATTNSVSGPLGNEVAVAPVVTAVSGSPRNMTVTVMFEYTV